MVFCVGLGLGLLFELFALPLLLCMVRDRNEVGVVRFLGFALFFVFFGFMVFVGLDILAPYLEIKNKMIQ